MGNNINMVDTLNRDYIIANDFYFSMYIHQIDIILDTMSGSFNINRNIIFDVLANTISLYNGTLKLYSNSDSNIILDIYNKMKDMYPSTPFINQYRRDNTIEYINKLNKYIFEQYNLEFSSTTLQPPFGVYPTLFTTNTSYLTKIQNILKIILSNLDRTNGENSINFTNANVDAAVEITISLSVEQVLYDLFIEETEPEPDEIPLTIRKVIDYDIYDFNTRYFLEILTGKNNVSSYQFKFKDNVTVKNSGIGLNAYGSGSRMIIGAKFTEVFSYNNDDYTTLIEFTDDFEFLSQESIIIDPNSES